MLNEVQSRFNDDAEFHDACLEASNWVLDRRLPEGAELTDEQRRSAVRYLLAEIPLFAGSARIVGAETSMFVYHQRVSFLERFFNRELSWAPRPNQGFLVVTQQEEHTADALVGSA
jgi:cyclo(L-tyrosyl-L-tyrosyl) synthase